MKDIPDVRGSEKPIYLDCAASAPVFPELLDTLSIAEQTLYANPSAQHRLGLEAAELLKAQRQRAAELLGCTPEQLVFCSGATEANNLALYNQLIPQLLARSGGPIHVGWSDLDHPSSIQVLRQLKTYGLKLWQIPLSADGELLLGRFLRRFSERFAEKQEPQASSCRLLCLLTAVDSESGRKQDLAALASSLETEAQAAQQIQTYIHADLSQYIAAEAQQLSGLGQLLQNAFDSMVISGQKIGAGRGAAILLQRQSSNWNISQGGGQEAGQRSGTENLRAICSMVRALELLAEQHQQQLQCSQEFVELLAQFPSLHLQPSFRSQRPKLFSPFIFSIAAPPLPAEVLQRLLSERGYMVGTGSACHSQTAKAKSRAEKLQAQGYERNLLPSILRISFGNGASYPSGEQLHGFLECLAGLQRQYA